MLLRLFLVFVICMCSDVVAERHEHTSLIRLLASAERYAEKPVSVAGVLGRGRWENSYILYFDHGSYESKVGINSLAIGLDDGDWDKDELASMVGKYVLVFGRFKCDAPRGLESGMLSNVSSINSYPLFQED